MNLSVAQRTKNIKKLQESEFDLLIIGGGITGAGVARDAASRGLKVALVESHDFAFGTSSRSSKLIHGGIRYLENLEFHLVFEALSERAKLFDIAPHLVHPLRFVLPVYEGFRVGMLKLGAGMWLYDALSLFQAPEGHRKLTSDETLEDLPLLKSQGLKGSFRYSDAYMDDDRLVIETLRSAAKLGATSANYVKALAPDVTGGKISALECEDVLTGNHFKVRAKHIVSSVGPWTDEVGESLIPEWKKILRPTKGIHLTFSRERVPIKDAVVMSEGERIIFAIPRHEMVIIGTTDTDYSGDLDSVYANKKDVDYLFSVIAQYFPEAKLTEKDVIGSYAGVRPLVRDEGGTEGKTSREHTIMGHPLGVTFVAGGKYTTYRKMASEVVEEALRSFSLEKRASLKPAATEKPLSPLASREGLQQANQYVDQWTQEFQRSKDEVLWLVDRFGMEAELMLKNAANTDSIWQIEARQAIEHGMCLRLDDFYFRRVPLYLAYKDHGASVLNEIAQTFADVLGWGEVETSEQVQKLRAHIAKELAWMNG